MCVSLLWFCGRIVLGDIGSFNSGYGCCGWLVNCVVGSPEMLFLDDNLKAIAHMFYGLAKLKLYSDQLGEVDEFVAVMEICLLLVHPLLLLKNMQRTVLCMVHIKLTLLHTNCVKR
jgi:hypothetical protein